MSTGEEVSTFFVNERWEYIGTTGATAFIIAIGSTYYVNITILARWAANQGVSCRISSWLDSYQSPPTLADYTIINDGDRIAAIPALQPS